MIPHQEHHDRPHLTARHERLPLERDAIKRWRRGDAADVVVAEIAEGTLRGRGEAVPFLPYGETIDEVVDTIGQLAGDVANGLTRRALKQLLPAGAARNAIDLALWDLESKRHSSSAWQIAELPLPHRLTTAFALPSGDPQEMASWAAEEAHRPILKLDLGKRDDLERIAAVHTAAPFAKIIVDAHGGWDLEMLTRFMEPLQEMSVTLIEQPVPPGTDEDLRDLPRLIPICADESCRDRDGLEALAGLYDAVNISLDKVGGFTEARAMLEAAQDAKFSVMISGALSSSLALAPAVLLAQEAEWVDLDAALRLKRDRQPGLRYDGSVVYPPNVSLWG